jgi:Tfp pilus assembly protein PilF
MHFFRTVLLCFLGAVLAVGLLPAQSAGSGTAADEYFRGYILKGEADRAELSGDMAGALAKFRQSLEIFDSIAKNYPVWESQMLSYRRQKVQEAISRIEGKAAAPAPAQPPVAAVPSPNPMVPVPKADAAPSPLSPLITDTAAPKGALPSFGDLLQQYEKMYKQRIDDLSKKNTQYEEDLKKWSDWYSWASGELKASKETTNALASRSAQLEQAAVSMQKELEAGRGSQGELKALRNQQAQISTQLSQAQQKFTAAEKAAKEANEKLMAATDKVAQGAQLLEKMQAERDAAMSERDTAMKERDDALKKTDAVTKERDKWAAESLGVKSELDSLKRTKSETSNKDLLAKNAELRKELDAAKVQIETLKGDITRKDAEIGQLKGQLATLQGELTTLRQQSSEYQKQVSELTLQMKEMQTKMETAEPESPELLAENQMLRSIILRQLRNQARQQQAKETIIAELKKTENASKALLDQVEELSSARFSLTPDEEKMFTDPQLKEALNSSGLKATLMAKSEPTDSSATTPAPPTQADPTQTLLTKANQALEGDDLSNAAKLYEEVLRAEPKNIFALIGLSSSQMRGGKHSDAEITLKKCLTYEPDNETALFNMGINYFSQQKHKESMTYFERSLLKQPKNSRGHHYLGIIATKMGLSDRAEREFKAVLAIDPSYGDAHFNLAVLYISWDPPKWDEARTHYADALKKGVKPDPSLEKILSGAAVSAR